MSLWTRAWIAWVAAFAIIEGAAITSSGRTGNDHGTLSAHLANVFMVRHPVGRAVWATTVFVTAVVFWAHIHAFGRR